MRELGKDIKLKKRMKVELKTKNHINIIKETMIVEVRNRTIPFREKQEKI